MSLIELACLFEASPWPKMICNHLKQRVLIAAHSSFHSSQAAQVMFLIKETVGPKFQSVV
jgi:hypothetical protein